MTSCPPDDVNTGTRLISICGWPTGSHGIQMLYEAPRFVALKCCVNCSGVKANLRSGGLPAGPGRVSS
jgi:hypothetical protein